MAPPHSACRPSIIFGFTLKVLSHKPKCGLKWRKAFAHNNEQRDMEDGVWSQIMQIQAIVEHEPPHKRIEVEAQATEEVRNKHDALIGLRCRDDLP